MVSSPSVSLLQMEKDLRSQSEASEDEVGHRETEQKNSTVDPQSDCRLPGVTRRTSMQMDGGNSPSGVSTKAR